MTPLRRRLVAAVLGGCLLTAGAGELRLPPVTGELGGDFRPLNVPGTPVVHWTLRAAGAPEGKRKVTLGAEGPGLQLGGSLEVGAGGEIETWKIEEGKFDLVPWFEAVKPFLPADLAELTVSGIVEVKGGGAWREGKPDGRATFRLREGRLDDPAHKLMLEGIAFELSLEDIAARRTPAVQLTWTSGRFDVVALGGGRIVFRLEGDNVRVDEATIVAFGGELSLAAFSFSLAHPEIEMTARIVGADVALFLPLLPRVVTEAKGRVDGNVTLARGPTGIHIGAGHLALREGETALLRLAPTPGLLSGTLPAAALKYYPGIGGIEKGEVPIKAEHLEIDFKPAGDDDGRTAWVHIAGGPVDPKLQAPVDLTINVRGPLETLINFGTDSRLHWDGH